MLNIIGLCGYAGVGKDTAAANMPGWQRYAFADRLKSDLEPLLAMVGCDLSRPEDKKIARPLLVAWGATARAFVPSFWIERLFAYTRLPENGNIVITDVRYSNEVRAILDNGGRVIRIRRPGFLAANDEELMSIQQIEADFMLWDVTNDSTPEDLGKRVLEAAKK